MFSLAALLAGCGSPTKSALIRSEPSGAELSVRQIDDAGGLGRELRLERRTTPARVDLPVGEGQRYLAVASAPQHLPAAVEIERFSENKTRYDLTLRRHLADTATFEPTPTRGETGWAMRFGRETVPAYVLADDEGGTLDPGSAESGLSLTRVTDNDDADVDLRSPAVSPGGDELLIQRVERVLGEPRVVRLRREDEGGPTLRQAADAAGVSAREVLSLNPGRTAGDLYERPIRVPQPSYVSQIYRQPLPGGPMVRLTRGSGAAELTPAYDADGETATYASDTASPNHTLWRVEVAGGGTRRVRVTDGESLDWSPSRGGDLLAYSSLPPRRRENRPQLWTAAADGSGVALVADGAESPAVSPDGRRICFVELVDAPGASRPVRRLAVMNADGSERAQLTANVDHDVRDPAWTPDGRTIVFAADGPLPPPAPPRGDLGALPGVSAPPAEAPRNFDLYALSLDGPPEPIRLTSNLSHDGDPRVAPDGRGVYFRSNRGGAWNLWRIDLR